MMYLILFGIVFLTSSIIPVGGMKYIGISIFVLPVIVLRYANGFSVKVGYYLFFVFFLTAIHAIMLIEFQSSLFALLQFVFFCCLVVLAINVELTYVDSIKLEGDIERACQCALFALFIIAMFQTIEFSFNGSFSLTKLFSMIQIYSNSYIINQIEFGYFRAIGAYFEPSFFAFVVTGVWVMLFCAGKTAKREDFIYLSIVLMSKSSLGVLTACLLLTLKYMRNRSPKYFLIGSILIIILFSIIFYFGQGIILRLTELNVEGSSGYYRAIAPLFLVNWILFERVFPIPFGSIEEYMGAFGIMNGDQVGVTIDNGYYVVLANFSWLGLVFCVFYIFKMLLNAIRLFLLGQNQFSVYLFFLIAPLYTGAIFSPEFLFFVVLLILFVRLNKKTGTMLCCPLLR